MHRLQEVLARLDGTESMLISCQKRIDEVNIKRLDERTSSIGNEIRLRKILVHLRGKGLLHHLNDLDRPDDQEI